jgi:hypothetical protein
MHALPEADQGALGERIAARLVELAAISDEPERLTRLYLGPAHRKAADLVSRWMREAGMAVRIDSTGNVVGRYRGRDPGPATLILGSHIDTVRDAGRFDGTLGVITAIEVVGAAAKAGKRYPFAIEVIAFGDEEGALSIDAERVESAGGAVRSEGARRSRRRWRVAAPGAARVRLRSAAAVGGSAVARARARLCRGAY